MSFFSGEYFYIVFTVVLLGALILGLLEKPLKWYNIITSALFVVLVLKGNISSLIYFGAFLSMELIL